MLTVSVITPSYNQGNFIERTIRSALEQAGDFFIEYMIVDGGSTDDTVQTIKEFDQSLKKGFYPFKCHGVDFRWVSEKDRGQSDAVNKGIAATSGEIVAWINSDDIYYPGAFSTITDFFLRNPELDVIYGFGNHIDENDVVIGTHQTGNWDYKRLFTTNFLCQPAVFFRRRLVDKFGSLDPELHYCMDYDLWLRFGRECNFHFLQRLLAGFRFHKAGKMESQAVRAGYEVNDMFVRKHGAVPREFIYNFARNVAEENRTSTCSASLDLDFFREIAQDAFLRWWGWIPSEELDYMDRFVSNPQSGRWQVRRQLNGLGRYRVGFELAANFTQSDNSESVSHVLAHALAEFSPDYQVILYNSFSPLDNTDSGKEGQRITLENVQYALDNLNGAEYWQFWKNLPKNFMANLGCPDILHVNGYYCPQINETKVVFSVNDLSFLDHPDLYSTERREFCLKGLATAARLADMVMAASDHLKLKFLAIYPEFPLDRIKVIHLPAISFGKKVSSANADCRRDMARQLRQLYEEAARLPKRTCRVAPEHAPDLADGSRVDESVINSQFFTGNPSTKHPTVIYRNVSKTDPIMLTLFRYRNLLRKNRRLKNKMKQNAVISKFVGLIRSKLSSLGYPDWI